MKEDGVAPLIKLVDHVKLSTSHLEELEAATESHFTDL